MTNHVTQKDFKKQTYYQHEEGKHVIINLKSKHKGGQIAYTKQSFTNTTIRDFI